MEQLCQSRVAEGYYDEIIMEMIRDEKKFSEITAHVMRESKGHENPGKVKDRINALYPLVRLQIK